MTNMKDLNLLKCLLLVISLGSLTNCTPKPPDVPACEHLGAHLGIDPITKHEVLKPSPTCFKKIGESECGHCTYIVTGREIFIGEKPINFLNGKPWSKIRAEAVYLPSVEAYAPLSTYIINACKKMKCSNDVDRFKVALGNLGVTSDEFKIQDE